MPVKVLCNTSEVLCTLNHFSPCVVGTLFEVTDLDTDVLSTTFMAYWIPSESPVHWKFLDKTKWKKAASDKCKLNQTVISES